MNKADLLLKTTATHFLNIAVSNLHLSLRHAVAFERSSTDRHRKVHAQHSAYHQFMALMADENAIGCMIESDEMHKFMRMFFARS